MTLPRLHPDRLDSLPAEIARPDYARNQPAGVVHLGTGAFHRAHQAAYFDALMRQGETGWMIRGASLRSAGVAEQMNPQGGLFTLVVRDGAGEEKRVIGSVRDVTVVPGDPARMVAILADPSIALVTLTVTEKGYRLDPETGRLQLEAEDLQADLATPDRPRTVPGLLVAALAERRAAGVPPFTVLSCDNLPENGVRTRAAVLAFAGERDPALADWIAAEGAFPSSMVDRIVPATTPEDRAAHEAGAGYADAALVKTEPFTQWVVEDRFCDRRPPLETVGVQMTDDVAAWERAKLRLLNSAHSALAYLGALAGHTYVHEAMDAPGFEAFVDTLWDEVETVLDAPADLDVAAYRAELKARFRNPALHHALVQIAMDGSQKLPQRLLHSLVARREVAQPAPALTLAVAAWMRWQFGVDETGQAFTVDDPLADQTALAVRDGDGDATGIVRELVSIEAVFGRAGRDSGLVQALAGSLAGLMALGAAKEVRSVAAG